VSGRDEGDLREQIQRLEARIEELVEAIERCRKIALMSRVAIVLGGILILITVIGVIRFDPMIMIGAIAAAIGGTVVLGSNSSTAEETAAALKAAEAHRAELIGGINLRLVGDGDSGSLVPRG
jgi:hypothetical protein